MRRPGVIALLAVVVVGLVALALVAAGDRRELAFTIGVVPTTIAAELGPGAAVCQSPIAAPDDFTDVRVQVGTFRRSGQPLAVAVRSAGSGRTLGRGRVEGGYPDVSQLAASVGEIAGEQRIRVCVRNLGTRKIALYGNAAPAAPASEARMGGRELETDLMLVFLRSEPRSMLAQLPDVFDRASVFRPGWVGPWVFWVLAALVLVGVPALLARALADSDEERAGEPEGDDDATAALRERPRAPARAP